MKRLLVLPLLITWSLAGADDLTVSQHWVSSGLNNRDLTLSPDGDLLFTTIMSPANEFAAIVMASARRGGKFSKLEIAPFSGSYGDIEAMFTPNGGQLWFASKRPKPDREGDDWDLWYVDRTESGWSEPINPGAPINTEGNEFYPSIATNGNVYFTAEREIGEGSEDILRAVPTAEGYRIESVGPGVNTERFEFNAFVAPDESYLIFTAQGGREGAIGRGDLYISERDESGEFGPARMLPEPINSKALDYCPFVHDGVMYFSSRRYIDKAPFTSNKALTRAMSEAGNGMGDIYSVSLDAVLH